MCSVSNQSPVQLRLAFEPTSPSSHTDMESYLKMDPPLIKIKRYSHKSLHYVEPTILTENQKFSAAQSNILNGHSKKSIKLRSKYAVSTSSSLDSSFIGHDENADLVQTDSCCRNSLISPLPKSKPSKASNYRQPSDTDELLRKVSVQLMRAQSGDVGKKCDKTKNWFDGQRSINLSSIESPKLSADNDTVPTSDDGGQFSGMSTPEQSANGIYNVIDEEQLRSACELIVEQQRKASAAFKKAKKNRHCSLSKPVDKKEIPLSNISNEVINTRCKTDTLSSKVSKEEGNISSEQFDSGHGSSEEHEITSKVDRFPSTGSTNMLLPISRPYYRYHIRRQKGLKLQNTINKIRDSVPSPLRMEMRPIKKNPTEPKETTEFKPSLCMAKHSRSTVSNIELLDEPNSTSSSSQNSSYLSSRVCSGHASYFSSSSSSVVDIHQLTTSCCHPELQESACTVPGCTKEPLLNCDSLEKGHKLPKQTVKATEEIEQLSLATDPFLSHTSKNSSKKENNKGSVKLQATLTRGCISCGFFTSACSKISRIRRTISGKASSALNSTRSPQK